MVRNEGPCHAPDRRFLISLRIKIYHRNVSPGQLIMAKSPGRQEIRPGLIARPGGRPGPARVIETEAVWPGVRT